MMMECPRCGLAQDKDRYCVSCGLDVDQFLAKPKPFFVRLAQNPNFHLTLIGILIVLVGGYIFFLSQQHGPRRVATSDQPLSSRDSAVGQPPAQAPARRAQTQKPTESATPPPLPTENVVPTEDLKAAAPPPTIERELQKVEVSFWEVPRETLVTLMGSAEKTVEGEGRGYFWSQGAKPLETLQGAGRRLSLPRSLPAQATPSQMAFETPATTQETFQFGFYVTLNKGENKDVNLKWDSSLVLPSPDSGGSDPANPNLPVVRALAESRSGGSLPMTSQSLVIVVFEPNTRSLKSEYFRGAGDGPWSIFSSEDFRRSATDWVAVIQAK